MIAACRQSIKSWVVRSHAVGYWYQFWLKLLSVFPYYMMLERFRAGLLGTLCSLAPGPPSLCACAPCTLLCKRLSGTLYRLWYIQLLAVAAHKKDQMDRISFCFFHSVNKNRVNKAGGQVVPFVTT